MRFYFTSAKIVKDNSKTEEDEEKTKKTPDKLLQKTMLNQQTQGFYTQNHADSYVFSNIHQGTPNVTDFKS